MRVASQLVRSSVLASIGIVAWPTSLPDIERAAQLRDPA
jgi:hypothetical protein